jgi:tetratricopeptide (TPR) repeat protein
MANIEKYKEQARKYELKEQWAKAIDPLVKAIEEFEATPDASDAELALYNRVGDLYSKLGDTTNAIVYYERAVEQYSEGGLVNNAIALCNKVLRIGPGRAQVYLKLGMLFHKKGFGAEAKQNMLEYADRMQKAGQLEEAFKALKKFAEMSPGSDEIWGLLAQQARAQARTPEATEQVDKLLAEFEAKEKVASQRKSRMSRSMLTGELIPEEKGPKKGELVFLDIGEVTAPPRRSAAVAAPVAAPPPPPPPPPPPAPEILPLEIETTAPPPPRAAVRPPLSGLPLLEVEPTALAEAPGVPTLEIEPTSLEMEPTSLEIEPTSLEIEPTSLGMEPTSLGIESTSLGMEPTSLGIEPTSLEMEPASPGIEPISLEMEPAMLSEPPAAAPPIEAPIEEFGALDFAVGEIPPVEEAPALALEEVPAAALDEAAAAGAVEGLPMLDTGAEAPPVEEAAAGAPLEFLDLGEVTTAAPAEAAEDNEARIAANPQDWEAHRQFGEALLEQGERERGLAELDASLDGYDQAGELEQAYAVTEEILRLEPNSVRHQQKRVELAYRLGDRARLVDAYVELADSLLRSDEPDKAIAVYQRVLEHDPGNVRAKSAIETLAPPTAPAPAAPAVKAAPTAPAGGYVDLGAMLLDEEGPKDLRMRIEDEEPTGDEQKDFQQMLTAFKKGIEANVGAEDFQSHFDLGVAYKEMGLLDEAIAEFQKALRATEGRLKSFEALGLCFFEKGQFAVAETILRRSLELPASSDSERLGILYWLGRSQEEQNKGSDALVSYNRVFAVDIRFQDVNQRVQALVKAGG